jgi:hypothetical protein
MKSMVRKIIDPSNCVIVMDNHKAHHNENVVGYLLNRGITIRYLPPNQSWLNPVERMWAYFKVALTDILMPQNGNVSADRLGECVKMAMENIKFKCLRLSEGPVKGMGKVFNDEVNGDVAYR